MTNQKIEMSVLTTGPFRTLSEQMAKRRGGPAEEKQRGEAGDGDHVGVLGHEKHRELHRRVFGVIAAPTSSTFGLGKIERCAVRLGIRGHDVDEERDKLESRQRNSTTAVLACADCESTMPRKRKRSGAQNNANQRKTQRQFIADELRRGAAATRTASTCMLELQPESATP